MITFSCELTDDTFQINKLYANKNILALLIAQQKNLEIASVREQYETQIDEISSAVDSLHKSQSFFDLYQVVCGEFKRVMDADLTEFRSTEDWQMLEKALLSFEAPDRLVDNCFREELESLKRYYDIDELVKKDIPWRKEDTATVIRSLKELLGDMLQFSPPSHVKLLLIDDKYLFIGSLNWLFNSGKTD